MNCAACGHANVEGARFCAECGTTLTSTTSQTDPHIGATAGGRYLITRVVGQGGMGVVYEAEQRMGTTVRKVAVKTLHAELSRDESIMARFHREVGTVAQLEHQNTVRVYDFGTMPDGALYIAMEFLAGQPLEKVIEKDAPLKPERVVSLLKQMSGSLSEAHSQGVVHRDLKPENVILIERAGQRDFVKLVDFGIAARTESADAEKEAKLTQQGMVLGTPPYMSPEQFTGQELDHRSDIYSLAVMAYEMLTGRLPFDATTPWQWATQHMTARPVAFETLELNVHVPHGMRQAILRALEKEPGDRFASVEAFVDALAGEVGTGTVASTAVEPLPPTSKRTAAMEAVPDFAQGPGVASGATAAMPAHSPAALPRTVSPPTTRPSSGPSKALLYGIVGGVGVLAAGLVFAFAGGEEETPSSVIEVAAAPESIGVVDSRDQTDQFVEMESAETDGTESDVEATAQEAKLATKPSPKKAAKKPTTTKKPAATTKPTTVKKPTVVKKPTTVTPTVQPPAPAQAANPTPPPQAAPVPVTPPNVVPKVTPNSACKQCAVLASQMNILGAAMQYRLCSDASKKRRCAQRARQRAPAAAGRANCTMARQIQAAANSMNAGSGALNSKVAACK